MRSTPSRAAAHLGEGGAAHCKQLGARWLFPCAACRMLCGTGDDAGPPSVLPAGILGENLVIPSFLTTSVGEQAGARLCSSRCLAPTPCAPAQKRGIRQWQSPVSGCPACAEQTLANHSPAPAACPPLPLAERFWALNGLALFMVFLLFTSIITYMRWRKLI